MLVSVKEQRDTSTIKLMLQGRILLSQLNRPASNVPFELQCAIRLAGTVDMLPSMMAMDETSDFLIVADVTSTIPAEHQGNMHLLRP